MCCTVVEASSLNINDFKCYLFKTKNSSYTVSFSKGSYLISLKGASGGVTTYRKLISPGLGGYVQGIIGLKSPKTFYIHVGSKGTDSNLNTPGTGGYNGGSNGGYDNGNDANSASAGSGGATDIRINAGEWDDKNGLISRIMVAGGGGSGACWFYAGKGGDGGGLSGKKGEDSTNNACIFKGGLPGNQTGGFKFGIGEKGKDGSKEKNDEATGAGGGGYWGGFSGENGKDACSGGGGGGGSSFISGHKGCKAVDVNGNVTSRSVHYSGFRFHHTFTEAGVNEGDGIAMIMKLSSSSSYIICSYTRKSYFSFIQSMIILICS